jgi:hypothetical protein
MKINVEFGNLWVTDLQKILNLKFMMMSHEFLYTCDTGEKKRSVQKGQMKAVKL